MIAHLIAKQESDNGEDDDEEQIDDAVFPRAMATIPYPEGQGRRRDDDNEEEEQEEVHFQD